MENREQDHLTPCTTAVRADGRTPRRGWLVCTVCSAWHSAVLTSSKPCPEWRKPSGRASPLEVRKTPAEGGHDAFCFWNVHFLFFLLWHAIQRLISVQSAHGLSSLLWEYSWQISNSEKVSISNSKTRPRFLTNATAFWLTDISAKESKYYKIPQLERNNDRNSLGITSQLCCGSAWSWGSPTSAHRGPEASPPAPDVGTHHALCQRLPINIRNHFATTSFSLISKGKLFLRFGVKIHLYQILGSVVHYPEVRDAAVHHPGHWFVSLLL